MDWNTTECSLQKLIGITVLEWFSFNILSLYTNVDINKRFMCSTSLDDAYRNVSPTSKVWNQILDNLKETKRISDVILSIP